MPEGHALARPALENILSGIDITIRHIATERTNMGTHRQGFLYDLPTRETLLGSEARIDSDHLMTGSLSLLLKESEKRAPTGVTDGFREGMVLDHPTDVQVLHHDMVIGLGVLLRRLEMEVSTLTCNLEMRLGSILRSLAASVTAILPTAYLALFTSQSFLRGTIVSWVLNRVTLAISEEGLETHVNPDIMVRTFRGKVFGLRNGFTDDESVPVTISTQNQVRRPGGSLYRAMHLDLEGLAQLLGDQKMLLVLMHISVFAVLSQWDRVPTVRLLESGEPHTRDVMLLGGKKAFQRLTETVSEHLDGSGRNMFALSLKSIFQVILAWESPLFLILRLHGLKHLVIDLPRLDQALHEQKERLFHPLS